MYKHIISTIFLGLSISLPTFAKTNSSPLPLYVGGYGGYGTVAGAYSVDGHTIFGRVVLGKQSLAYQQLKLGGEIGIQSGNDMRLESSPNVVDPTTAIPPQAVLKPLADLLITAKGQILQDKKIDLILKAGIAYRQLQLQDRTASIDNLEKVAPEFQAGFGINMTEHVMLTAFYQGIYSNNNAGVSLDDNGNTAISHIPTQQAGFLGIEYSFF